MSTLFWLPPNKKSDVTVTTVGPCKRTMLGDCADVHATRPVPPAIARVTQTCLIFFFTRKYRLPITTTCATVSEKEIALKIEL